MNTVPKLVAPELRQVLENGVNNRHRSFIIMVGSKCLYQVPTIYDILSKIRKEPLDNILWCYKKDLQLSSNQEKQNRQIQKLKEKGLILDETANKIHVFLQSRKIRYCRYKDTSSILGKTYDMLILQNFEDITPNNFARTIETVSGGGTILLLLESMQNLKDMYNVSMSFHKGMRDDQLFGTTTNNLALRFYKSIQSCGNCVCIDDEYNVLSQVIEKPKTDTFIVDDKKLNDIKKEVSEVRTIGQIVSQTVTYDQAETVLRIYELITTGQLDKVIGITASRGRGKSAALGLSIAAAVNENYSNIFVTAPSPENLNTLFEFILIGFDKLGYKEHSDYDIVVSNSQEKKNQNIIRINIHRSSLSNSDGSSAMRQTISYIKPTDYKLLDQCELLAIDEAAAIPLPIVRKLLGRYTVFLSSTVNGYEGTGRALSLKLFKELQKNSKISFTKVELNAPIRYAPNDPIEKWLHSFLCLDAQPTELTSLPDPNKCELVQVNRTKLFSGEKFPETILNSIVSLSVASHYKNEPDDLILMADSPNHRIFALLEPMPEQIKSVPAIICYIQVALEGRITREQTEDAFNRQQSPKGDLIPWKVAKHLSAPEFPQLTGIRVVRIAVHPDMQGKGYGGVAIKNLLEYYSSKIFIDESQEINTQKKTAIFTRLTNEPHEKVDYASVSFGLTEGLFKFWRKSGFLPVYIAQGRNQITGEHSIFVLRKLDDFDTENDEDDENENEEIEGFNLFEFCNEFRKRFGHLLSFDDFDKFSPKMIDMIFSSVEPDERVDVDASSFLDQDDVRRLQRFSKQLSEYEDVKDLMPVLAEIFFIKMAKIQLTRLQQTILASIGLQHCSVDECAARHGIQPNQVFAYLQKISEAFFNYLSGSIDMSVKPKLRIKSAKSSLA